MPFAINSLTLRTFVPNNRKMFTPEINKHLKGFGMCCMLAIHLPMRQSKTLLTIKKLLPARVDQCGEKCNPIESK